MRRVIISMALGLLSLLVALPAEAASYYGTPQFEQTWQQGEAIAPNFWGPLSTAHDPQLEPYAEGASTQPCPPGQSCAQVVRTGQRLVQYFDKGRMERTTIGAPVTSGLLASELVRGQVQTGDKTFQQQPPPAIPIAGDPDNPGPTYAAFTGKATGLLAPATSQIGSPVTTVVAADGTVMANGTSFGNANIATFDDPTKHNVPGVFVDYRNKASLATIGYAISEPFLATVKVAGQQKQVMIQVFERRVLTFTPDNPVAFQVEMGNIGQHYYRWRYPGGAQ
jgi:hypothetical protein